MTVLGDTLVIVGTGASTSKVRPAETPPPGPAVVTVSVAGPHAVKRAAGMMAVSVLPSVTVVANGLPSHRTIDGALLLTKLLPVMVIVTSVLPRFALPGERLVIVGAGFATVSTLGVETAVAGAGLLTMMLTVLASVQEEAGRVA